MSHLTTMVFAPPFAPGFPRPLGAPRPLVAPLPPLPPPLSPRPPLIIGQLVQSCHSHRIY